MGFSKKNRQKCILPYQQFILPQRHLLVGAKMDNAPGFFDQGGAYIKDLLEMALEALEEGLLFSTEQVPIVILFAFLGLCSAVFVIAWQRNSQMKHWLIGGAFAMLPLATFAILLSLESMRGGPDDRCHKYDQGKLPLNVIGIYKTRQDQRDIFSGEWVLLVVRSVRWGNDPHLCRVNIETA